MIVEVKAKRGGRRGDKENETSSVPVRMSHTLISLFDAPETIFASSAAKHSTAVGAVW